MKDLIIRDEEGRAWGCSGATYEELHDTAALWGSWGFVCWIENDNDPEEWLGDGDEPDL